MTIPRFLLLGGMAWTCLLSGWLSDSLSVVRAQTKLPTMDEALAISQKTGRPIFAMAGRKT